MKHKINAVREQQCAVVSSPTYHPAREYMNTDDINTALCVFPDPLLCFITELITSLSPGKGTEGHH